MHNLYNDIVKTIKNNKVDEIDEIIFKFKQYEKEDDYYTLCIDLFGYVSVMDTTIFDILLKHININHKQAEYPGNTFLMRFIRRHKNEIDYDYKICENFLLLLDKIDNINEKNVEGDNVLLYYFNALYHFNIHIRPNNYTAKIIGKMLELGVNIFERNASGLSAIDYMASSGKVDRVIFMLDNAKVDGYPIKNIPIDVLFCTLGSLSLSYDVIELLLPYIDDINGLDTRGHGIKVFIRDGTSEEILELLRLNGARI